MRRFLLCLVAIFTGLFMISVALALPAGADTTVNLSAPHAVVHIDPLLLSFLLGSLVPLVTAVLTKASAGSGVKAVVNLLLSVGAGVLAAFQASPGGNLTFLEIATAAVAAYLTSGSTYQHLWKPTGIAPGVQRATRSVGVG